MPHPSLYPEWMPELLQTHLSQEELEKISSFLHTETWISPSAHRRLWNDPVPDIPLRFHLDIDIKE
ncbi:hypothetical protein CLV36_11150 [Laceyella sediminis]|uniref:Uncharacterized protein n=2 Tax=Laceyella TaxID=292635 RepID=A0AA46AFC8_9BACL|nr:hypothetical protein CLV36_11150 [Laceyella sediminis]SMP18809.1 hypothetical protein SAMN06265361_103217 [Laceyella tengchongensis]